MWVQTQERHACNRLERFQVRECTCEIAGRYDGARRADHTTTASEIMTRQQDVTSSLTRSGCMAGSIPTSMRAPLET